MDEQLILEQDDIQLFADPVNAEQLSSRGRRGLGSVIRSHLDRLHPGDYFGILAYVSIFPEYESKLQRIRKEVLEAKHVATVLGFGPRLEYSAGRVYLNGPNTGVFVQITCGESEQARNYFQALTERQRRVLRIHFPKDLSAGLDHLLDVVRAAIAS